VTLTNTILDLKMLGNVKFKVFKFKFINQSGDPEKKYLKTVKVQMSTIKTVT